MSRVPSELDRLVRTRAEGHCEYCCLSQQGQEARFHVDHVVPLAAGGPTRAENLALACVSCSLRKAARQAAQDPQTGTEVPIYNPRHGDWSKHFRWEGLEVRGLTPSGRATVEALAMNRPLILAIRLEESIVGRHPRRT